MRRATLSLLVYLLVVTTIAIGGLTKVIGTDEIRILIYTFQEINGRALHIEENKQVFEPDKGFTDKEFDTNVRFRRQAETTEEPEGSGGTTEPLLVEDPPGIGLGFILGKNKWLMFIKKNGNFRCCFTGGAGDLYHWHHIQAHQDTAGNICGGGASLSKIQIKSFFGAFLTFTWEDIQIYL